MLQWGRAFSATAGFSMMPLAETSSPASLGLAFTQSTEAA